MHAVQPFRRHARRRPCSRAALLALAGLALVSTAQADPADTTSRPLPGSVVAEGKRNIAQAFLADPTTRYDHFVLGTPMEAARLVVRFADGRSAALVLPPDEVFEDRIPRLADLNADGRDEIVLVRSSLKTGSSLVVVAQQGEGLAIIAQSPTTGAPRRWLNPAGIADFDGDGRLDVAYVQQPHVLGQLRVFTLSNGALREIATYSGVANHVAGSSQQGLSAVADFDGDGVADLALPTLDRRSLLFLSLKGGPHLLARHALSAPAATNFALAGNTAHPAVNVGLTGGAHETVAP